MSPPDDHNHTTFSTKRSGILHPRLRQEIHNFVAAYNRPKCPIKMIKIHLEEVVRRMFEDGDRPKPDHLNRSYYPSDHVIRFHVSKALRKRQLRIRDQERAGIAKVNNNIVVECYASSVVSNISDEVYNSATNEDPQTDTVDTVYGSPPSIKKDEEEIVREKFHLQLQENLEILTHTCYSDFTSTELQKLVDLSEQMKRTIAMATTSNEGLLARTEANSPGCIQVPQGENVEEKHVNLPKRIYVRQINKNVCKPQIPADAWKLIATAIDFSTETCQNV